MCGPYRGSVVYGGDKLNLKLVGDSTSEEVPGVDKQRFSVVVSVSIF